MRLDTDFNDHQSEVNYARFYPLEQSTYGSLETKHASGQIIELDGLPTHYIEKGSRFEIIDEAGHCPHDDQPDRFNRLALDFLAPNINDS